MKSLSFCCLNYAVLVGIEVEQIIKLSSVIPNVKQNTVSVISQKIPYQLTQSHVDKQNLAIIVCNATPRSSSAHHMACVQSVSPPV